MTRISLETFVTFGELNDTVPLPGVIEIKFSSITFSCIQLALRKRSTKSQFDWNSSRASRIKA